MRGFLFADLRDYTRYVETRGDHAGAELLERYQALVREAIAGTAGAEVRTEGDSFYVVFDSASAAVTCGLEILAAAAASDPGDPIRVGVGVHAGETVETAGGFVGSAVNIAARLCAEARAGELVVSETVRGLTRTYLDVAFEPLGARRLKGIAEPVPCYRVAPRGTAPARGARGRPSGKGRRPWLLAAGLGLAAVTIVAAGAVVLGRGQTPAPTPGPSAAAGAAASVSPAASTAAPSVSPTLGPFPNEAEARIMAALPPGTVSNCRRGGTSDDALLAGFAGTFRTKETEHFPATDWPVTPTVLAGITCKPPTGAARMYVAEPEKPPGFSSAQEGWADEYMSRLTGLWTIPLGSCATEAKAYTRWRTVQGTGIVACMNPYQGRPWIYFTFAEGRYLGFATRDDADYDALYAWWEQLMLFLP